MFWLIVLYLGIIGVIAEVVIVGAAVGYYAGIPLLVIGAIAAAIYVIGKPALSALIALLIVAFAVLAAYCIIRDLIGWYREF